MGKSQASLLSEGLAFDGQSVSLSLIVVFRL